MALAPSVRRRAGNRVGVVATFVVGLLAGGLVAGTVLWLLSGLSRPVPAQICLAVLLPLAGLAILRDLGIVHLDLPQNRRQVPRTVFSRGVQRAALQFGFELGTGVRTYVPTTVPYLVALAVLLVRPGLLLSVLAGLGFGLGRALGLLARFWSGEDESWDLRFDRAAVWIACVGAAMAGISLSAISYGS